MINTETEHKINKLLNNYFIESCYAIKSVNQHLDVIKNIALGIYASQKKGGKVIIGGNGGSCADAQHFAGELTCTYKDPNRRAFSAVSMTTNASAITAWANDFGFDSFFKRQVIAQGATGDVLFLISTGGGDRKKGYSMNLVEAADKGKNMGLTLYSIVGKTGGELSKISDECIIVKSNETSHIQEAHISIIHAICESLDILALNDK